MKKSFIFQLILLVFIATGNIYPQAPDWTRILQIPGYPVQMGDAVTADDSNAYFAAGISGPVNFYGTDFTSTGLRDILLIKLDNAGNLLRLRQLHAQTGSSIYIRAITVDGSQNIYIAGDFTGTITIGSKTFTNDASHNSFIAKLDANYNVLWATDFLSGGMGTSKFALDVNSNLYLMSKSTRLIKFKSTGELEWEQIYPDRTLWGIGIFDSKLFIGGALQMGNTNLGSNTVYSEKNDICFLARTDLNGNFNNYIIENTGSVSSKDGNYAAFGTFTHPTAGVREINMNKIVTGTDENTLSTTVGDLPETSGSVILTINPGDNTITISGFAGVNPVYASGINSYDPGTETFTLNYSYDASGGSRVISEVLTKTSGFVKGSSAISDIAFDDAGNLIITGGFTKGLVLGSVSEVKPNVSYYTFIAKCDTALNFSWIESSTANNTNNLYSYTVFTDNLNGIFQFGPNQSSFSYGDVNIMTTSSHFLVNFDVNGQPNAGYTLPYAINNKVIVSKSGKILSVGSRNYIGATDFGNFYIEHYNFDMQLEWQKSSFGTRAGIFDMQYVKHDDLGNTYVQATSKGYCDYFGNTVNGDLSQTIIAKHDKNGVVLWLNVIPDDGVKQNPSQNLSLDKNNNLLKVGSFVGNLSIGSKFFTNLDGAKDSYVAKYNTNGSFGWAVQLSATGKAEIYAVNADASGNVIITGAFNGQIDVLGNTIDALTMEGLFVIKFSPTGNIIWAKGFPVGNVVYIATSSIDSGNFIYVASDIYGASNGILNFEGVSTPQNESETSVILKLDPDGNPIWVRSYGGVLGDPGSLSWPCNIKTDPAGFSFIWGWCMNNGVFGQFTLTNPIGTTGVYSYYLAKLNPNGDVVWAKGIHQKANYFNYGDLLDLDKKGNIYVGGHFKDLINIDGSLYSPEGTADFFVTKYLNDGTFQWIKTIPSNTYIIYSLSVVNDNALSVGGNVGKNPVLGKFPIVKNGGTTSMISTLGNFNPNPVICDARFEYTEDGDVSFTDLSLGNPTAWSWDFGDGKYSTEKNPVHTYDQEGIYTVSLTIFNQPAGCISVAKKNIIVGTLGCTADFDVVINTGNGLTEFTSKSEYATDYYWDFGDQQFSTEPNPVHTYSKTGVYTVCLTILNNETKCQSKVCKEISYIPATGNYILAEFSYYNDPQNLKVTLNDLSSTNATSWYWTMGDGKILMLQNPVYTYAKAGVYRVCLTVTDTVNSLSQTACKDIRVGNIACTTISSFSSFIDPVAREVSFYSLAKGNIDSYFWTFGDGTSSTSINPVHYFAVPGYYKVTLVVRNTLSDCIDSYSSFIQVGSVDCRAGFDYSVDPTNNQVSFKDNSKGLVDSYYWDLGDGAYSVEANPVHRYKKADKYMVGQTVIDNTNGCMDFIANYIQVGDIVCSADFVTYIDSSNFTAYFTNKVMGNSSALLWSFGDGKFSTESNPVHQFPGEGIYSTGLNTYDMVNGCMDYYEEMLLIGGIGKDCGADFIYSVDPVSLEVSFQNNSLGEIAGSTWNFGDESENSHETNPVHEFPHSGYYNVCLGVINPDGIKNMICKWILIQGNNTNSCLANFMFFVDSANLKVKFVDNSFGEPDKYSWDFGDKSSGLESVLKDPEHTYAQKGYYMVKLKIENSLTGCVSKEYKLLNVAELQVLKAAFSYEALDPDKKRAGYPVDLVSASSGDGSTVEWDFGDKEVKKGSFIAMESSSRMVTHYYDNPGKYYVCLRISDPVSQQEDLYCEWVNTKYPVGYVFTPESGVDFSVYPNPVIDYTSITYSLPQSQNIEIVLFDQLGRKLETFVNERKESGEYQILWNTKSITSGVYYLKMITSAEILTRQLVISK